MSLRGFADPFRQTLQQRMERTGTPFLNKILPASFVKRQLTQVVNCHFPSLLYALVGNGLGCSENPHGSCRMSFRQILANCLDQWNQRKMFLVIGTLFTIPKSIGEDFSFSWTIEKAMADIGDGVCYKNGVPTFRFMAESVPFFLDARKT